MFRAAVGDSSQFAKYFTSGGTDSTFSATEVELTSYPSGYSYFPLCQVGGDIADPLPSSLRHGQSSISTTHLQTSSSSSSSSSAGKRVRVAVEGSSVCLYRTISVTEADRAGAVVREAMKKYGIEGDPSHYHLQLADNLNTRKSYLVLG